MHIIWFHISWRGSFTFCCSMWCILKVHCNFHSLQSWKTMQTLPESQVYLLLCLINMHVFGTHLGSAGMLSSTSFFIYMRLGGVTYGASWLSWIGIFIKPCELCIGLLIIPRSTFDPARTLNSFPLGGMIHSLVKAYMCSLHCRRQAALQYICNPEMLRDFVIHVWQTGFNICTCLNSFIVVSLPVNHSQTVLFYVLSFFPIIQQPVQQIILLSGLKVQIWQASLFM